MNGILVFLRLLGILGAIAATVVLAAKLGVGFYG